MSSDNTRQQPQHQQRQCLLCLVTVWVNLECLRAVNPHSVNAHALVRFPRNLGTPMHRCIERGRTREMERERTDFEQRSQGSNTVQPNVPCSRHSRILNAVLVVYDDICALSACR